MNQTISFLESNEPFLQKATTNVQLQYNNLSSYNWTEFVNLSTNEIDNDVNLNIQHFSVIGIQENIGLFIHQLKRLTGFNLPVKIKQYNNSESEHYGKAAFAELPKQIQSKAIALISEKNAEEIQFYKEIKLRLLNNT